MGPLFWVLPKRAQVEKCIRPAATDTQIWERSGRGLVRGFEGLGLNTGSVSLPPTKTSGAKPQHVDSF